MGCHMKTTIDIAEPLLREAKRLARREGVTLRVIVERGLDRIIAEGQRTARFKLRKASYKGKGLRPELHGASWETLRDLAYRNRGT